MFLWHWSLEVVALRADEEMKRVPSGLWVVVLVHNPLLADLVRREERRLRAFHVNLVGRENVNLPVMRRLGHVEQEVLDADGVDKEVPLWDGPLRSFLNFETFERDVDVRVAGDVEEAEFFRSGRLLARRDAEAEAVLHVAGILLEQAVLQVPGKQVNLKSFQLMNLTTWNKVSINRIYAVWPDETRFYAVWQELAILKPCWQNFKPSLSNIFAFWLIFIVVNEYWINNLAIWSHWFYLDRPLSNYFITNGFFGGGPG